jgi:hypothetical protein
MTSLAGINSERAKSIAGSALAVLVLMMGLVVTASAQGQGPERDATAIAVLQNSVFAMGGSSSWQSVQDWTITGTVSISGSSQPASSFSWIGAGMEFRLEVDTSSTTNVFLSGHGSPARILNGTVTPINSFVARANPPFYLPGVRLMQELDNSQLTIQYVGTAVVHGRAAVQVHVCDNSDAMGSLVTPHDWYFDASSFLPLQVQIRIPPNENAADYLKGTFDFWQFQTVNAMLVPSQLSLSKENLPTTSIVAGSVTFNSGVPQSEFNSPQGGQQ